MANIERKKHFGHLYQFKRIKTLWRKEPANNVQHEN